MSESIQTGIRFKPAADQIPADEVALLESILPEIIQTMMRAQELNEKD